MSRSAVPAEPRPEPSETEVEGYFQSLSNWGRWGADDQRGTINHITAGVTLSSLSLAKSGECVSCAWPLAPIVTADDARPVIHHMTMSGEGAPEHGRGGASDWIGTDIHGFGLTHIDALS